LLSITNILIFDFDELVRAEISCKNVRSPNIAVVESNFSAIPKTVEILPSIPAKPLLANTSTPPLG
jgi:hypothetical protein